MKPFSFAVLWVALSGTLAPSPALARDPSPAIQQMSCEYLLIVVDEVKALAQGKRAAKFATIWVDMIEHLRATGRPLLSTALLGDTLRQMETDVADAAGNLQSIPRHLLDKRQMLVILRLEKLIRFLEQRLPAVRSAATIHRDDFFILGLQIAVLNSLLTSGAEMEKMLASISKSVSFRHIDKGDFNFTRIEFAYYLLSHTIRHGFTFQISFLPFARDLDFILLLPTYEKVSIRDTNEMAVLPVMPMALSHDLANMHGDMLTPLGNAVHDTGHAAGVFAKLSTNVPLHQTLMARLWVFRKFQALVANEPDERTRRLRQYVFFHLLHEDGVDLSPQGMYFVFEHLKKNQAENQFAILQSALNDTSGYFQGAPPTFSEIAFAYGDIAAAMLTH